MEGLVTKAISGFFYLEYKDKIYECKSSTKLKRNKEKILPGDIVVFDLETKYITAIKKRKNQLIRPQIANIEKSILVFSLESPKMNYSLLDKFLATMEYNEVDSIILCTKIDLLKVQQLQEEKEKLNYYQKIGYTVIYNNEINDLNDFSSYLKDNSKYVITGQSGVGKTTFLNKILNLDLPTNEISKALGRGKHTTRETTFYKLDNEDQIYLIDTPGFSSFQIEIEKEIKPTLFKDFFKLSHNCKFNMCMHKNEPECAVKKAVENGDILQSRYINYLKFLEEK